MHKYFFLAFAFFFYCVIAQAQKLNVSVNYVTSDGTTAGNTIYYQPGQSLSWDDFKGKPLENSEAAAITSAGFGIKLSFREGRNSSDLVISVSCNFSKKDSWVKANQKNNYILNHEQRHFDITYVHTVLFIDRLRKARYTPDGYVGVIEKIYNETAVEMAKMQHQYDSETSHSRVPAKQAEWNSQIEQLLNTVAKR